jgi:hypothetical protein
MNRKSSTQSSRSGETRSEPYRRSCETRSAPSRRRERFRPGSAPHGAAALAFDQIAAALRLPLVSGVGAFLAVETVLKALNARAAKKICAERQARIAQARKRFVSRIAQIAVADSWDSAAYNDAISEFSAARTKEIGSWDSSRAITAHRRAKQRREEAWTRWIEEFVGEITQLFGVNTVMSKYKTPVAALLDMGLESLDDTLDLRRRIRAGTVGEKELETLLKVPPAPGERRRTRKGAPIRRLCMYSISPPPDPKALLEGWEATRGHGKVAEKIRLGSLLLDAEASVDSSLIRDKDGEIVGRKPGLKGWLERNCPQLMPHYGSLMRFRRLAAAFREEHGIGDPVPAVALVEETKTDTPLNKKLNKLPETYRQHIDEARKKAAQTLASTSGKTVAALTRQLVENKTQREEINAALQEGMQLARRRRHEAGGKATA